MIKRFRYDFKSGIVADGKGDFISYAEYEVLRQKLVALTEQRDALIAENATLREAAEFAIAPDMWEELGGNVLRYQYQEWYADKLKAALSSPATDAARASLRAEGVEMLRDSLSEIEIGVEDTIDLRHYCSDFARQLRDSKGANHE